jgi:hypothetical protein
MQPQEVSRKPVLNKMQHTEDPNTSVCNQMQFALIQNKIPKEKLFGDYVLI